MKDSEVKVVNQIGLEDYTKGVMIKEMPVGKGTENYEALKAFSICIRTYAYNKINENKDFFDIYPDTRDQVYGGVDGETKYTNSIVDETRDQILIYDTEPAIIFITLLVVDILKIFQMFLAKKYSLLNWNKRWG